MTLDELKQEIESQGGMIWPNMVDSAELIDGAIRSVKLVQIDGSLSVAQVAQMFLNEGNNYAFKGDLFTNSSESDLQLFVMCATWA
jgi:hypothetical protein